MWSFTPSKWERNSRLVFMLVLTTIIFFAEIIVGYLVNSIALIADSFHMLSDMIALLVALYAIKLAKRNTWSQDLTYGWQRAEVLGALINAVFLLALCFTIFLESIQRFFNPVNVENPRLILIVGGLGLCLNLIGLLLFHDTHHRHGEGGHEHDHEHHHHECSTNDESLDSHTCVNSEPSVGVLTPSQSTTPFFGAYAANQAVVELEEESQEKTEKRFKKLFHGHNHHHNHDHSHSGHMNMQGIFLHIFGDFLGSIGVITAALIIWLSSWEYRFYFDPLLSLIMTSIMLFTTIPLLKRSSHILLQGMPSKVPLDEIRKEISDVEGVLSIHELHIWQLSEVKLIASVHITCLDQSEYMKIAMKIKQIFHNRNIHSVTVQPEFSGQRVVSVEKDEKNGDHLELHMEANETSCLLACNERECGSNICCPPPT